MRLSLGGLTSHGRAVHDLKLGDRLALIVLIRRCSERCVSLQSVTEYLERSAWVARRTCSRRFSPDDAQLHVLDLDPHEEEVDLADDDVLEVVPWRSGRQRGVSHQGEIKRPARAREALAARREASWRTGTDSLCLVVLELDVEAVLDANLHLDRVGDVGWHPVRVDPQLLLLDDVGHPSRDGHADEVPARPASRLESVFCAARRCAAGGSSEQCVHARDKSSGERDGAQAREQDAPQLDVDAVVALVLLLDVLELKVERLRRAHLARGRELLHERQELVVVAAVVEELCRGRL